MVSCNEKLIQEPENLIDRDTMVSLLTDLAIVSAGKSVNIGALKTHDVDPTGFVFEKYGVDSLQFVESDQYYASLPMEYEKIYSEVETRLEKRQKNYEALKKERDSLAREKKEKKKGDNVLKKTP
ncbi:MAG: DUF4296 domain-containing protein [Flavobacteriaceae bacterium]